MGKVGSKRGLQTVAIIIPIYKESPNSNEIVSLKQCLKILRKYPFIFICPLDLNIEAYVGLSKELENVYFIRFDPTFFNGIDGYNKLLISIDFYKRFQDYQYILIHQLDAYVFRDELNFWCNEGYDYIGAPWLSGYNFANKKFELKEVGNGGFSLRKVKSHLRVLQSFSYIQRFGYFYYLLKSKPCSMETILYILKHLTFKNNTFHLFNNFSGNEDGFWSTIATRNFKWFNVPSADLALKFSIETYPSKFIHASEDLPFGCHAWERYEPEFWKQYITSTNNI